MGKVLKREGLLKAAPFAILCIQTDHGSEFTNRMFESLCEKKESLQEHVLDPIYRESRIRRKLILVGQCEMSGKVERSQVARRFRMENTRTLPGGKTKRN